MGKNIKTILITLNVLILILAIFWYSKDAGYESLIVLIAQIASILAIIFEKKLSKTSIKQISDSKVNIKTSKDRSSNIEIESVKKGSSIKIDEK